MGAKEDLIHCVFIAGRTTKQGQQINTGKDSAEYWATVTTLMMNPQDIARLGLTPGMHVRARTEWGEAKFQCAEGDLPPGIVFVPYGPPTSRMMGGNTDGTGMPTQKGWEVEIEPVTEPSPVS
jgi:formylmethanofuran dehydrogenase subunit D